MSPRKGVAAIGVFHPDGRMLWGRRKDNGKWTTPAGHLEDDETPHAGALRELHEEAGLHPDEALEPVGRCKGGPNDELDIHGFHATCSGTPTTENDPDDEVEQWKWVDVSHGLPKHMHKDLHVPLEKNLLLRGLAENDREGLHGLARGAA